MKFLCVACDEPMNLQAAHGPFDGSMTIVYECPQCSFQAAMLTNRAETQMVRSLGVKIGGRSAAAEPMETLRSSLAVQREDVPEAAPSKSGRCPFTGVVSEAFAATGASAIEWSDEARTRLAAIPDFVRPMVQKNVEDYARERGYRRIDASIMDDVKGSLGM